MKLKNKPCSKCKKIKEILEFYKDNRALDGLQSQCKKCMLAKNKLYRQTELYKSKRRKWRRKYRLTETGGKNKKESDQRYWEKNKKKLLEKARAFRRTEVGKACFIKATKKERAKFPEKYISRSIFSNAIASGKIQKQPCKVCGKLKVEGHHEDYSKPLDVVWLCRKHHNELHEIKRRKINEQACRTLGE